MLTKTYRNKLNKWLNEHKTVECPICHHAIHRYDDDKDLDYVKTKRGGEYIVHTDCIRRWGD